MDLVRQSVISLVIEQRACNKPPSFYAFQDKCLFAEYFLEFTLIIVEAMKCNKTLRHDEANASF